MAKDKDVFDQMATDELAKLGITKKAKPEPYADSYYGAGRSYGGQSDFLDDDLDDWKPTPLTTRRSGRASTRGTSWEPDKTESWRGSGAQRSEPSRAPVRSAYLGPKDKMQAIADEWKGTRLDSRMLDRMVTIATTELASLLRLADLEPPKHQELYLMVEGIVRASRKWVGIGTKPIEFDD